MDYLSAISPLDGRYHNKTKKLQQFFSEKALIEKRIFVENQYLKFIIPVIRPDLGQVELIEPKDGFAERVKEIEEKTKHDVKAVEYYLQELYEEKHPEYIPYIHIGLTSADINSVARSLILKESTKFMAIELG
jgi:adenylosuccinate lyase